MLFVANSSEKLVSDAYSDAKKMVFSDKPFGKLDKTEKGETKDFKYAFEYYSKLSKDHYNLYILY